MYSFADDTAIVYHSKDVGQLANEINADMRVMSDWFSRHRLHPNLSKTKIVTFGYKNKIDLSGMVWLHTCNGDQATCVCEPIGQVNEIKYLGVMLDSRLTWAAQSQYLQCALRKLNYMLYYLSQQFSRSHLIRVYKAIYDSKLRYGIVN